MASRIFIYCRVPYLDKGYKIMDDELNYYRYNDPLVYDEYSYDDKLDLEEYEVIKKTTCGVWILFPNRNRWNTETNKYDLGKKFILERSTWYKTITKKRFAWPTKKEALNSYIYRKIYQIARLEYQLENGKSFLAKAKEMQIKDII